MKNCVRDFLIKEVNGSCDKLSPTTILQINVSKRINVSFEWAQNADTDAEMCIATRRYGIYFISYETNV